jgi:hypothetical protein
VHAAPPVRVTLGRSLGWIAFNASCAGAAAANLTGWALMRAQQPVWPGLALGLVVTLGAAWAAWRAQSPSDLNWDGSRWQYADGEGGAVVMLDLGDWLLLRFEPAQGRRRWIAASRRSAQGPWAALRAALYSSRPADPLGPQQ